MRSTTAAWRPPPVSEERTWPEGARSLSRSESQGLVEVVVGLECAAFGDSDPGRLARRAAALGLLSALGLPEHPDRLSEVAVHGGGDEPPSFVLRGETGRALGARVAHLSLTHEGSAVAAFVVVEG